MKYIFEDIIKVFNWQYRKDKNHIGVLISIYLIGQNIFIYIM